MRLTLVCSYSVSGHRMSTAEVESSLIMHPGVSEAAAVGANDEVTGQGMFRNRVLPLDPTLTHSSAAVHAFVCMKPNFEILPGKEAELQKELAIQVRKTIGPFAAPKKIYLGQWPLLSNGAGILADPIAWHSGRPPQDSFRQGHAPYPPEGRCWRCVVFAGS